MSVLAVSHCAQLAFCFLKLVTCKESCQDLKLDSIDKLGEQIRSASCDVGRWVSLAIALLIKHAQSSTAGPSSALMAVPGFT